jgi:hypothetical protein
MSCKDRAGQEQSQIDRFATIFIPYIFRLIREGAGSLRKDKNVRGDLSVFGWTPDLIVETVLLLE